MIEQVTQGDFHDRFQAIRPDNFTYAGRIAMFEYLEELEHGTGKTIELDVISICVDWSEYDDLAEVQGDYNDIENLDDLRDSTIVIEIPNTERLIVESF